MEEEIKILKEHLHTGHIYVNCGFTITKAIENILNRLEQDERVIEEMAKQIEKDTEWYLSDFEDMTVEEIIDHFRKKCE